MKTLPIIGVVARCVPRHDGACLIVTRKGQSGVSRDPIEEGAHVRIVDGVARPLNQPEGARP